ncbi:DNA polymerase III subunit beta [filamentous cyanobacterium LEGE 11480]|uniref:Beta sliding clamp n=1 Tax=Romeriopsis navalis LEGE 11480 TaxID=2777977 RepID=A0A928Z3E2_9CYAN|nr:DNA polymerase III subunit beta [Romeriopsis navalis]MBE9029103.1 DNA polymerase III subunit beta [Romeriopsis navalis LEGE 11480]
MKLICSQSNLNANLSLVSRAVSSRPTHPVLANVLLNADEESQTVKLCAFDLSLGIQTSFPAQVKTGGVLTLPAKLLSDIISRLPDGEIILDDGGDAEEPEAGLITTITSSSTSSSGRYQVRGLGAEDFPELPTIEAGDSVQLPAEALIDGLKSSLFSASSDETKQVLTGVHLNVQAEGLEFAATDGHRLAVVQTVNEEGTAAQEDLAVTVPAKALQELIKMLERSSNTSVAVKFDPAQAVFEWGDQRLTSRLLEAQYPNYQQLLPKQFSHQMTIDRRLFLGALERISVLADQRNNIVKLSLDPSAGTVQVSVDAQDVGSGQETVAAQISGDAMDVAFNVRYLIEGLKVVTSTEIQLQLNTPTSPAVLVPLGSLKMQYLVMPVQIRS